MSDSRESSMETDIDTDSSRSSMGGLEEYEEMMTMVAEKEQGTEFEISRRAALLCNLVKSILEGDESAKRIVVKNVKAPILTLIIAYLEHHDGEQPAAILKPIRSVKLERIVEDEWDVEFIGQLDKKTLFELILGSNYMDLPPLLHLACARIATLIKGKSPAQIKHILVDDDEADTYMHEEDKENIASPATKKHQ